MGLNYMKLKYIQVSKLHEIKVQGSKCYTNLWIPPSHHIYLTFNNLGHIVVDGTRRFPLLHCYEKGRIRHGNKRAVIGQFQKARLLGKLEYGCLVCCQTCSNLIRDLMS